METDLAAQATTWVGIAASGIATLGGVLYAAIAVVKVLVEKKYDARFKSLEFENGELKSLLVECKAQHDASENDRAELWRKLGAAEHKAELAATAAHKAETRITELESQLAALRTK